MRQIELNEAMLHLPELIQQALQGREIIITENNLPLLKLARIAEPGAKRTLGAAQGEVWMAPDFNESYDEWAGDLETDPLHPTEPAKSEPPAA
ncbi:MAG: type II toxin-antitoxin system prevent-host-death family antitoxin [Blastocatellia bacterium]|nr:type II toxin-antitoxin system prevent-host-death family antitoxin [Blastocatellia bacterium]